MWRYPKELKVTGHLCCSSHVPELTGTCQWWSVMQIKQVPAVIILVALPSGLL